MAGRRTTLKKILRLLGRSHGSMTQSEIQLRLKLSKSYLSELLRSLENDGRIYRTRGDGRTKNVILRKSQGEAGYFNLGILKSSEYIPLVAWLDNSANKMKLKLHFYNSTDRMFMDLDSGSLQACCAPLVSLITNFIIRRNFRIAFGLGYGGSYIFINDNAEKIGLLTSENSSMSLLSARSFARDVFPKVAFSNPVEGVRKFIEGEAKYISIWEPYASYLRNRGYRQVADYRTIMGEQTCCAFALSEKALDGSLPISGYSKIHPYPPESSESFDRVISRFSRSLGIERTLIEESLHFYSFKRMEIDAKAVEATGFNVTEDLLKAMISEKVRGKRTQQ